MIIKSTSSEGTRAFARHVDRRAMLRLAGASAMTAGMGGGAASAWAAGLFDGACRLSAARLDALVADAFPAFNKPSILPGFDATTSGARHDVELHRIVTSVALPETDERLKISGLLALPVGVRSPPVVSWQHGTILSFDQVPSNLVRLADPAYRLTDAADSLETLFNVHRFAGRGYAVIAADYVGKGPYRNGRGEAYAVRGVTERTCLAMLGAGHAAMRELQIRAGDLFLNGWSQGALNTQWLHQALRRRSRPVRGTAVASPFNDLVEAWRFWAGAQTFPTPAGQAAYPASPNWISLCMIVALGSYELNLGLKGLMESAIRPEFHGLARKFWADYSLAFDPAKPFPSGADLLVPGFFDRATDERNSAFIRLLAANSSTYWGYDAPIRFHFGLADEAIHPVMVSRALVAGGPMASGVPVAGGSHRGTFLASLYGDASALDGKENIVDWFDRLRAGGVPHSRA